MLHHLLPPVKNVPYDMRPRVHNRCLPADLSCVQKKNFIGCSIKTFLIPMNYCYYLFFNFLFYVNIAHLSDDD